MSYCRWSSDGWRSDVYCYEDVSGGWTTHVARRRRIGLDTLPPDPDILAYRDRLDEWAALHKAHMDALGELGFEDIGLPYDGETFNDPSLDAFEERLRSLKQAGYHVPEHVFDDIAEERSEGTK